MMNQYFGEMQFSIGWKTKREITLFDKACTVTVKIQAYEAEDEIPSVQEQACRAYIEHEAENLKSIEQLMTDFSVNAASRFSPRTLLFKIDGGCALLCDDEKDLDEGIAVCILPDKCVEYQSNYL